MAGHAEAPGQQQQRTGPLPPGEHARREADRERPSRNPRRRTWPHNGRRRRQEPRTAATTPRPPWAARPWCGSSPVSLSSTNVQGLVDNRDVVIERFGARLIADESAAPVDSEGGLRQCRRTTSSALAMSCASRCGAGRGRPAPPWTAAAASAAAHRRHHGLGPGFDELNAALMHALPRCSSNWSVPPSTACAPCAST